MGEVTQKYQAAKAAYEKVNVDTDAVLKQLINRVAAWVIGTRNTQKALLKAMLEPIDTLKEIELSGDYTTRLAMIEELKDFPFADVWNYFCEINNVPVGLDWLTEVKHYEKDVLSLRK